LTKIKAAEWEAIIVIAKDLLDFRVGAEGKWAKRGATAAAMTNSGRNLKH
jgi:hypothetical protein